MRKLAAVGILIASLAQTAGVPELRYRFSSGTVIVISIEDNAVILAADSRAMTDEGHTDDDCKLLAFGDSYVFTSAGQAHVELYKPYAAVWDARVAARQSIAELPHNENVAPARDLATSLAASWGNAATTYFGPIASHGGADALRRLANSSGEVVEGIFAVRAATGDIALSHTIISLDSMKSIATIKASPSILGPGIAAMGNGSIVRNYVPRPKNEAAARQLQLWEKSVTDKPRNEKLLSFVAQLAQWTVDAGLPGVGGDVDEVLLNGDGVNWIRRKRVCLADSSAQNLDVGSKRRRE